ncbi:glycosyltransferase [Burkholderia pyrrocinia]|uniref:glycosyltransferase n=1 Tax=Burkholderia pyrrocinia TaxID=60550 RepID=UPI001BCD0E6D|nr:glycosyltransferase [Burkholderia pyrrocinia]
MTEAMSCGTPVMAFNRGLVPEAIDHGITGHVSEDVQRAAGVLQRLDELSRTETRARFERRFSAGAMAQPDNERHTAARSTPWRPGDRYFP